jgi:hypothetical protein
MTDKITITLGQIFAAHPYEEGWKAILKALSDEGRTDADEEIITFPWLYSHRKENMLWYIFALGPEHASLIRHFLCDIADSVRHLMKDERSTKAIDVSRLYADGLATEEELKTARKEVWAAGEAGRYTFTSAIWAAYSTCVQTLTPKYCTAVYAASAEAAAEYAAAKAAADAATYAENIKKSCLHWLKYVQTGERVFPQIDGE